jgi:hypothetical protein
MMIEMPEAIAEAATRSTMRRMLQTGTQRGYWKVRSSVGPAGAVTARIARGWTGALGNSTRSLPGRDRRRFATIPGIVLNATGRRDQPHSPVGTTLLTPVPRPNDARRQAPAARVSPNEAAIIFALVGAQGLEPWTR